MFDRMRAVFGRTQAIAARSTAAWELKHMREWLRGLEAMVRKLILIEAKRLLHRIPPVIPDFSRRSYSRVDETPKPPRPRSHAFRIWPRPKPHPARIRLLGEPTHPREIWRERARQANVENLKRARKMRVSPTTIVVRRIEALARVLEKPLVAARRLARKLRAHKKLAFKLGAARPPRSRYINDPAWAETDRLAYDTCAAPDTS